MKVLSELLNLALEGLGLVFLIGITFAAVTIIEAFATAPH